MALFTVDSNNTFGKSVQESGSYNVVVLDTSSLSNAKSTGNEMLTLNYEVVDGDYIGGHVMYDNFVWNPDNVEMSEKRFNTLLVAAAVPDGTDINSVSDILKGIIGKKLNITTEWKQSDYNQKWNLNVKGYALFDKEGSKPDGNKRPGSNQGNSSQPSEPKQGEFNPWANGVDIKDSDLPF